jgi:hypothetical protein
VLREVAGVSEERLDALEAAGVCFTSRVAS